MLTACEMQLQDSIRRQVHMHISKNKKYESELEISRSVASIRKMCSPIEAALLQTQANMNWCHVNILNQELTLGTEQVTI
jgi:hypothetical protein